jgi:hypothetical protein
MTKRIAFAHLFALALALSAGAAQARAPRDGNAVMDGSVVGGGGNSIITQSPASGEGLRPVHAQGIDLGAVSGVAYYTVEHDGFRVVVTLAQRGEDATVPVRLEAVLTPGQSVLLSAARGAGSPPDAVEISRHADTVLVRQAAAALTN